MREKRIIKGTTLDFVNHLGYLSPKQVAVFFGRKGGSVDALLAKYNVTSEELPIGDGVYTVWRKSDVENAKTERDKLDLLSAIEKDSGNQLLSRIEQIEQRLTKLEVFSHGGL